MDHSFTLPSTRAGACGSAAPPDRDDFVLLSLPSVDQPWHYAWAWVSNALAGWRGKHRLHSRAPRHYRASVQISPRLDRRWRALFDVPARAAKLVPLLTNQSVCTLMVSRLFAELGVNPRHVLHVQHRTAHHAQVATCARSLEQDLQCHVKRILRLGEDRVLVEVQTQVRDPRGQLLSQVDDGFVVGGLPSADLAGLPSDRNLLRELLGLRRRLPRLSINEGDALVSEMPVESSLGRAYGRLSGEVNPIHAHRLGAWLLGLKRPVLQGLALRNLVVRHLVELGAPVDRLRLTLAAPAVLGQPLLLVLSGHEYEVQDAQGRLVAFGSNAAAS
jgi:MaoC like domain